MQPIRNFCMVEVATGYDAVATVISLIANDGAKLPDPAAEGSFNLVWFNYSDHKNPSDDPFREIIKVTAKTNDQLTIQRGRENIPSTAKNLLGKIYKLVLTLTKENFDSIVPGWHGAIPDRNDGNIEPVNMGSGAVDFQFHRSNNSETALGDSSFIAGGYNNKSSAQASFTANCHNLASGENSAALGSDNVSSGPSSFCANDSNVSSGDSSSAFGQSNKSQGIASFSIGMNNIAGTEYSFVHGNGAKSRLLGQSARANGYFNSIGDCQISNVILRRVTEDENPLVLSLDMTDDISGRVTLQDETTYLFKGYILGKSLTALAVAYEISGIIQKGLNNPATALVGNPNINRIQDDSLNCSVDIEANPYFGSLDILVTGQAAMTIKWFCSLDLIEIIN